MAILLYDPFNYPNGTKLETIWPDGPRASLDFYVEDGECRCDRRGNFEYSSQEIGDRSWVDYKVSVKMRVLAQSEVEPNILSGGIMFRCFHTGHYGDRYDFTLEGPLGGNAWRLACEFGGNWYSLLAGGIGSPFVEGTEWLLAVICEGPRFRGLINGRQVFDVTEPLVNTFTHPNGSLSLENMNSLIAWDDLTVVSAPVAQHSLGLASSPVVGVPVILKGSLIGNTPLTVAVEEGVPTIEVPLEVTV